MSEFRHTILDRRKFLNITQAELAQRLGVSQATVSRLEGPGTAVMDLNLAVRMAKILDVPVTMLLADEQRKELTRPKGTTFFSFCDNPFCLRNKRSVNNGDLKLFWTSGDHLPADEFEDVNYCFSCGESLVKACKNCGRPATSYQHCVRCGSQMTSRPTPEEWTKLQRDFKDVQEPEIPF